jgi:hypothetical protein
LNIVEIFRNLSFIIFFFAHYRINYFLALAMLALSGHQLFAPLDKFKTFLTEDSVETTTTSSEVDEEDKSDNKKDN